MCFEHRVCVSFIPTSTDTDVHRTTQVFAVCLCIMMFVYIRDS